MEHKHFFSELPDGYKEDYTIDAQNKKTILILNIVATVIGIGLMTAFYFTAKSMGLIGLSRGLLIPVLIFFAVYIAYVILHELTHGAAYKIYTKEKLTFGVSLTVAFCGVPSLYVKKKAALVAVLAPFTVFTAIFGIPLLFIKDPTVFLIVSWLFAAHLAGCVGDLYGAFILIFRYKGKPVIVNDTGPKQTYYLPDEKD